MLNPKQMRSSFKLRTDNDVNNDNDGDDDNDNDDVDVNNVNNSATSVLLRPVEQYRMRPVALSAWIYGPGKIVHTN